ncbi:MAG: hypothetical protein NUV51_02980 [Sulfuricaulis sp.]|nr:hypothetical protein [Sulfuricaulis sp.]
MDWKTVWSEAVGAAEKAVKAKAPGARKFVKSIAEARKKRLELLLLAMADGALDEQTIDEELKEEKAILESEFLAVQVMVKKAAQDAANALIGTIEKALFKGIDFVV